MFAGASLDELALARIALSGKPHDLVATGHLWDSWRECPGAEGLRCNAVDGQFEINVVVRQVHQVGLGEHRREHAGELARIHGPDAKADYASDVPKDRRTEVVAKLRQVLVREHHGEFVLARFG